MSIGQGVEESAVIRGPLEGRALAQPPRGVRPTGPLGPEATLPKGLKSLWEISFCMSFRGAEGDEESRTALKTLRARFLASLGMTARTRFSHRP
jgi:hypothetical protein